MQKLAFSELRYRRLFEAAQDGILILDADSGKITDANPFLKNLLGYSDNELIGKQLWKIGVFKGMVDSKQAFWQLQAKSYIRHKDLLLQTKDNISIDVEVVSSVYMVGTEKVIQCNIRDIADRKKSQAILQSKTKALEQTTKSQEETKQAMLNVMEDLEAARSVIELEKAKDEAMLASIGEGLIAVDNEGKVMVMNKVAEEMLGLSLSDLSGKPITDLLLTDETGQPIPLAKRPTTIALTTGETTKVTYFFTRKDKRRFPMAITATPIKLGKKTIGLVEIVRDTTHELEIDKSKSEFVSLASHQLRTPLGIMKWYLEALETEGYVVNGPSVVRAYFNEIFKNNERVLSLVRDLLSVSRIEQGRVKNVPKPTNVIQVVLDSVEQMKILAQNKKITLTVDIIGIKSLIINIDILRFREVVDNLLSNAINYTEAQGYIEVTIKKHNGMLLLSIKDTGIGISEVDKKRLFTKFFRSEKAIDQNPEGSGLGLYLVKSYVEGWGGKIVTESTEKKGSKFIVSLPIIQKKNAAKEVN